MVFASGLKDYLNVCSPRAKHSALCQCLLDIKDEVILNSNNRVPQTNFIVDELAALLAVILFFYWQ
ncbi:hypothetical protein A142_11105 [Vibrio splendidus 12E03]|jgi:hypothetical protein|uniref:Uncharacterized protein n=1 Tax=Vibrio splendidus 12E03 TaxID=1191305 RepID=A0A1E5FC49_VIBSP|nr:hypothetical protein A142_11105 [Vibrio splendidus 12E03]